MDDLDRNLMVAWNEVRAGLDGDAAARGRRYERGLRAALRRPVRGWCVSIKASDARIESSAFVEPGRVEAKQRHRVVMFGELVRHLVKPVEIDWPGMIYDEAAVRLGIDVRTMILWMDRGWVGSRRERVPGRRGSPTRYVWTRFGGIDVALPGGRGAGWGCLWRDFWEKVPGDFEQVLERVPRMRAEARTPKGGLGGEHFRGWDWVCPGRVAADGRALGCGRVCKKLVGPLPVWTLSRAFGEPAEGRLVAEVAPVRVGFACGRCWNVQHTPSDPDAAWNQLVSVVSGGVLYGREVEQVRGWGEGHAG